MTRRLVVIITVVAAVSGLTGIRKAMPFAPNPDEGVFVGAAARLASGVLNPGWFGHPGSTTIDPLAAIFAASFLSHTATPPTAPPLGGGYGKNQAGFYLAGRVLSVGYFAASIPLVFLIGRRTFNERVGVIAAGLASVLPTWIAYAQVVRSDAAATFFGLLTILATLKALEDPTRRRLIILGATAGLGVASRYFMAAFAVVALLAVSLVFAHRREFGRAIRAALTIGTAVILAFLIVTPAFVFDLPGVMRDLSLELEPTHLGADGLSPLGNLWWYLTRALPADLTAPIAIAAVAGIALSVSKASRRPQVLMGIVGAFLLTISASRLHWYRWPIEVLPVCCVFAAYTVDVLTARVTGAFGRAAIAIVLLILAAQPVYQLARHDWQQGAAGPRLRARAWVSAHVPAGSKIAEEFYSAPLKDLPFEVDERQLLASAEGLADYSRRGFRFLIVSSRMYGRILAEPQRYPLEAAFYNELFSTRPLLAAFTPTANPLGERWGADCYCGAAQERGESTIRIYRVD